MRMTALLATALLLGCLSASGASLVPGGDVRPSVYLIGDSTVKTGTRGLMGWGTPIQPMFDGARIRIYNRALGGRSSRSYFTEGLWEKVRQEIKPGDYVLMQFGHNDGGGLRRSPERASIKGIGDETEQVTLPRTGKSETVHSYGWYLRQYVRQAKEKGATPIVLSPIPRNIWKNGKVARASADYGKWAKEVAESEHVPFINLNELVARRYEAAGEETVKSTYFTSTDHTHTTPAGAKLNAEAVVEGIRSLPQGSLKQYLAPAGQ